MESLLSEKIVTAPVLKRQFAEEEGKKKMPKLS